MSDGLAEFDGVEHSPLRVLLGSRTRVCIHCGHTTVRIEKKCDTKFNLIKNVFRYRCLGCKKETSPWTQINYEDMVKRLEKIYNTLLQYAKAEQIRKVWINKNGYALNYEPPIENLRKILFLVTVGKTEFKIPCSYTLELKRYYESPIGIKKDKGFKKAFAVFKKAQKT